MIKKIECLSTVLKADKKIEFEIETISLDGNLYDGDNVSLEMTVVYPDLTEKCFYAFYYGDNKWRFRLCFYDGGEYTGRIILRKSKSIADQKQISFVIEDNEERKGLLQVEKVNKKHFQFRNGEVFTAVGENMAWGERNDNGNFYERVCPKLHKFGGNWTRLWLTTEWYLNMLPKNSIPGDFSDSTQAAELLDKLIEIFEENDIYVQLVLFNHTNLNSKRGSEHDRNWHDFTFNSANANGYLDSPDKFFTSERAKKDVKNYIRYIVSRYGYSNSILCWELFNEVNMAEARNEDVYSWHREMVGYLREIDSMGHMITTSSSTPVYSLIYDDMFDFINQHRYGAVSNIYHMISDVSWISLCYRKPVILSECGSSWTGSFVDRTIIHQHLWAGLMCNSAGTGMHWFWENIDKLPNDDGYRDLKIVSDFAQNIPWNANGQTFITAANIGVDDDKVNALGYKNSNYYYLWFYDAKFTFCNQSENIFKDTEIRLELENGDYEYFWLDSWTGQIMEKSSVSCDCGSLRVKMPAWKKDITFSIKKKVENE